MDLPHPNRKRKSFQPEAHDGPLTEMGREHKGSKTLKKRAFLGLVDTTLQDVGVHVVLGAVAVKVSIIALRVSRSMLMAPASPHLQRLPEGS